MSLKDRALELLKAGSEEKEMAFEEAKTAFMEEARREFAEVFDVNPPDVGGVPVSIVKAKLAVEGMEFIADKIPEAVRHMYGGSGVKFTLRMHCDKCNAIYRTEEVNSIEELGEALAQPTKHKCKVLDTEAREKFNEGKRGRKKKDKAETKAEE